jgi:hypothetical protein
MDKNHFFDSLIVYVKLGNQLTVIGKRCHLVKTAHPSLVRSGVLTGGIVILMISLFAWAAQKLS